MLRILGLTRAQTPAVSTLHAVFSRMDREAFETALGAWLQARGLPAAGAIAVEGKTLRGIHGEGLPGVHLVASYAHQCGLVAGQVAAGGKGQELAAVKALLEQVPLQGWAITGDAQFAQRGLSEHVVGQGGLSLGREGEPAHAAAHWGIENRGHWVRDATFEMKTDARACPQRSRRVRTGAAPRVLAALRNTAISLVRLAGKPNIAAALRRHAARPTEALAPVGLSPR